MKLKSVVLLLSLLISGSSAVTQTSEPVDTAFEIYAGCVSGFMFSAAITPTEQGVNEFVQGIDKNCLYWTIVWYQPIAGRDVPGIQQWSKSRMEDFDDRRDALMGSLHDQLMTLIAKK